MAKMSKNFLFWKYSHGLDFHFRINFDGKISFFGKFPMVKNFLFWKFFYCENAKNFLFGKLTGGMEVSFFGNF